MTKYQRQNPLTTLAMTITMQDRIITAKEARLTAEYACFCLHCRCPLLLYDREPHLPTSAMIHALSLRNTWSYALKLICQRYRKIHVPPWCGGSACCATGNTLETGAVPFVIRDCIASWRQKSLRKNHLMPLQRGLTGKRQLLFTSVPIV